MTEPKCDVLDFGVDSDASELVYVGETSSLKERMKDLRRTVNHTFRRRIGEDRYGKLRDKYKFTEEQERDLNDYIHQNFTLKYLVTEIGRKEIEDFFIENSEPRPKWNKVKRR